MLMSAGIVKLIREFTVCNEGEALTAEQAKILVSTKIVFFSHFVEITGGTNVGIHTSSSVFMDSKFLSGLRLNNKTL